MGLKGPRRLILQSGIVGSREAAACVVGDDAAVPLVKQPQHGAADHLVGVAVAQPAGAQPTHMPSGLQQNHRRPFPGSGNRSTASPGCRSIHEHVGLALSSTKALCREQENGGDEAAKEQRHGAADSPVGSQTKPACLPHADQRGLSAWAEASVVRCPFVLRSRRRCRP